jgi:molybdate transport system regulatory protein
MTRLTIRIDFEDAEGFGPGKARLLELIEVHGSIRSAAAAMNMSYRHAWRCCKRSKTPSGR